MINATHIAMPLHPTVPAGLCVAHYKGTRPGLDGLYNRVGRYLDRGPYSHTELIFSNRVSASASFLDGGVRFKDIGYSSVGNWDFQPIDDPTGSRELAAFDWFCRHNGEPYDILGNIRFAFGWVRDSPGRWYCNESVMTSLGYREAYRIGPCGTALRLQDDNKSKLIEVFA